MTRRAEGRPAKHLSGFAAVLFLLGGAYVFIPEPGPGGVPSSCCGETAARGCAELPGRPAPALLEMNREAVVQPSVLRPAEPAKAGGAGPGPGGENLPAALGLCGGIDDIDYLLALLGSGAGREEVALATRLLGYNRDLVDFPGTLVERILGGAERREPDAAVLLLELGLKILCSPAYKKGGGALAARQSVELVLEVYAELYAAVGEPLAAVTETLEESGCIVADDLEWLLSLAESVPGMKGLVLVAAEDLTQLEPGWAERNLLAAGDSFGVEPASGNDGLAEAAALGQLEPSKALDYIARKESAVPVCNLARMRMLKEITARSGEEELLQWIRDGEESPTARLLVSSLSHKKHSGLLERLAFSVFPGGRLRAGAVVKLSGYRADEEIARAVLSLLADEEPGRMDLFVQASENLLIRSHPQAAWFGRIASALESLQVPQGGGLAGSVQADLSRVLGLYRSAVGAMESGGKD